MSKKRERLDIDSWIVGFTDGEGCFSVSMFKNHTTKSGWQVFPEFVIAQGEKSKAALEAIHKRFGVGKIYLNKRYDNHHEHLYKYCVRTIADHHSVIIPFFKTHPLLTAKQRDFEIFTEIVEMLDKKEHFTDVGLRKIAKKIEQMNRKKASKYLESLETKRRPQNANLGEDRVLL